MASMRTQAAIFWPQCRTHRPVGSFMIIRRWVTLVLVGAVVSATAGQAAELPSQRGQTDKSKKTEYVTPCNVAGSPGVQAADGVCVRFSGYVSSKFGGGQLKSGHR